MFVQTRSSLLKGDSAASFEARVFKKRKSGAPIETVRESIPERSVEVKKKEVELDMKKLRYEIIKFGTTGLDGSKKEESRVALAVALGAKPQKKKYRNYKEILREKRAALNNENKLNGQNRKKPVSGKRPTNWKRSKDRGSRNLLNGYGKVKQD